MKKLFLALVFVFGFTLVSVSDTFAVSDYSTTVDWDNVSASVLCGSNSGRDCSNYSYVKVESSGTCLGGGAGLYVSGFVSSGNIIFPACTESIFPIPSDSSVISLTGGRNLANNYTGSVIITLTDDICHCPIPEPCPDPEENSRFIQVVIDAFWKYHIGFAGAAAAILAIFFVYRIIKGRLR